jgi:hypothetical protein
MLATVVDRQEFLGLSLEAGFLIDFAHNTFRGRVTGIGPSA